MRVSLKLTDTCCTSAQRSLSVLRAFVTVERNPGGAFCSYLNCASYRMFANTDSMPTLGALEGAWIP